MNGNTSLGDRLKKCREEMKLSQKQIAEELNTQRQIISYYETGSRTPDIEDIVRLARFFHVSSDYLLGLSDCKSVDVEVKAICEYTGLSESALYRLNHIKDGSGTWVRYLYLLDALSYLLEKNLFIDELLENMCIYTDCCIEEVKLKAEHDSIINSGDRHGLVDNGCRYLRNEEFQDLCLFRIEKQMIKFVEAYAKQKIETSADTYAYNDDSYPEFRKRGTADANS